jgi:F-type H+-transporting ATPase subunit alpha
MAAEPREKPRLDQALEQGFAALEEAREEHRPSLEAREVGTVTYVGEGVVRVAGLKRTRSEEMLAFEGGSRGMAFNVDPREVGVVLLDEGHGLAAGSEVRRTGRVVEAPVGDEVLGRVLDPRGRPLDNQGPLEAEYRLPAERPAPAIMDRAPVNVPLQTGLKVVDAMIPIGRGQRELILGDRQTGKTAIALDAILNQRQSGVVCIYCAVGKRTSAAAKVVAELGRRNALSYTAVVVATEEDPPGLQFFAPYVATSMGEHFMSQGRDVLVIYDDLTRHARAYRELSLLLRRPPGREAYPGDIFYIHSRLLERSTHLRDEKGGGSLTALPIIETEAQNISAYIPTNLISITDGQIYLSPDLFQKGVLPAVDVGKSVSRVGGKTQLKAYRAVAGDLRLAYSQFEELEAFARFGTRLDEETKAKLERGRRVRELLKQPQYRPLEVAEQVAGLVAVNGGAFDSLELEEVGPAEGKVRQAVKEALPELCRKIAEGGELGEEDQDRILRTARQALGLDEAGGEGRDQEAGEPEG